MLGTLDRSVRLFCACAIGAVLALAINDCNYESDWGIVCFEGERVSRVDFSSD